LPVIEQISLFKCDLLVDLVSRLEWYECCWSV